MNIDAKAREIAESTFGKIMLENPDDPADGVNPVGAINIIAAALLSVRNEALEEAAKVADEAKEAYAKGDPYGIGDITAQDIADAIRALKTTTG